MDYVNIESYGAVGDGSTDCTSAINAAIATGKTVTSSGATGDVFMTDGGHVMNVCAGQRFLGNGTDKTIFRRRTSSALPMFQMIAYRHQQFAGCTLDGNNLNGGLIDIRDVGQKVEALNLIKCGNTYAMLVTGNNAARVENIYFGGANKANFGNLWCHGALYSSFVGMQGGQSAGGWGYLIEAGSQSLDFLACSNDCGGDEEGCQGTILIDGGTQACNGIHFYSFGGEVNGGWTSGNVVKTLGGSTGDILFKDFKYADFGTSANAVMDLQGTNIKIDGFSYARNTQGQGTMILLRSVRNAYVANGEVCSANTCNFLEAYSSTYVSGHQLTRNPGYAAMGNYFQNTQGISLINCNVTSTFSGCSGISQINA